jgi:hypothetical protein
MKKAEILSISLAKGYSLDLRNNFKFLQLVIIGSWRVD